MDLCSASRMSILVLVLAAGLVACTSRDPGRPSTANDVDATAEEASVDSSVPTDAGPTSLDGSTAPAPGLCPAPPPSTDAGYAIVAADWSFAASAASLSGGRGELVTISRCDTVVWTNRDTVGHSIVSTGGGFSFHTALNTGGRYAPIQFPVAGSFTYECGIHGSMMIGQITVK